MAPAEALRIELVCSPAAREVWRWAGELPAGSRLDDAVVASGVAAVFPALDAARCAAGIWGRPAQRSTALRDGDRVELYRPLVVDPKEARRLRYRRQRGVEGDVTPAVKPRRR